MEDISVTELPETDARSMCKRPEQLKAIQRAYSALPMPGQHGLISAVLLLMMIIRYAAQRLAVLSVLQQEMSDLEYGSTPIPLRIVRHHKIQRSADCFRTHFLLTIAIRLHSRCLFHFQHVT